jgi:hypothetical protein
MIWQDDDDVWIWNWKGSTVFQGINYPDIHLELLRNTTENLSG